MASIAVGDFNLRVPNTKCEWHLERTKSLVDTKKIEVRKGD
jgi:hypothetical protein